MRQTVVLTPQRGERERQHRRGSGRFGQLEVQRLVRTLPAHHRPPVVPLGEIAVDRPGRREAILLEGRTGVTELDLLPIHGGDADLVQHEVLVRREADTARIRLQRVETEPVHTCRHVGSDDVGIGTVALLARCALRIEPGVNHVAVDLELDVLPLRLGARRHQSLPRTLLGQRLERLRFPRPLCRGQVRTRPGELGLQRREALAQLVVTLLVAVVQHQHAVFAPTEDVLRDVGEEGPQGVEVALGEGIELVVVALGAAGGLPHPRRADRAHPVGHHAHFVVLGLRTTLLRGQQQAVEGRTNPRFLRGIRQQVTGDLFESEAIEALVGVEGLDHPVAVGPDVARVVAVVADGVGETHDIEPGDRHTFPVVRIGQQPVDQLLVRVR